MAAKKTKKKSTKKTTIASVKQELTALRKAARKETTALKKVAAKEAAATVGLNNSLAICIFDPFKISAVTKHAYAHKNTQIVLPSQGGSMIP